MEACEDSLGRQPASQDAAGGLASGRDILLFVAVAIAVAGAVAGLGLHLKAEVGTASGMTDSAAGASNGLPDLLESRCLTQVSTERPTPS